MRKRFVFPRCPTARDLARDLARYGTETQDTFGYNARSEKSAN